ncbi:MAG: hypothetical protein ACI4F1_04580 [Bariatricus sp.]
MGKQEKWNRLMDAFSGKGTAPATLEYPEVELAEMVRTLEGLSEKEWGRYAFSREPLEGKFSEEQKEDYTAKANACGREWAEKMAEEYGTRDPRMLAEKMGMKVDAPKVPVGGGLVLFAQFVEPNEITIFTDCVDKAAKLEAECGCEIMKQEKLMNVLLAHELFHAVEEQHAKEIFTRTEKVELWRKPFSNRSTISCLSEIAAMAFAAQLLGLTVSPYMLDVLLVYSYDRNAAWGLYDEILSLNDKK